MKKRQKKKAARHPVSPPVDEKMQDQWMDQNRLHATISKVIAAAIGARPLQCWRNAALAVLQFPELFATGHYIEGWIVLPKSDGIEVVEHGWCQSPLLGIIDPSIVLIEDQDQPVFYFPGFELSGKTLASRLAGKTVPLVCNTEYGHDGMGHQGYRHSYEQAQRQARNLAHQQQLPPSAIFLSTRSTTCELTTVIITL